MVEEIIEDDYFIPSPILKGTLDLSSGVDPISAFQKIGIKYNHLLEEHWAKIYEVEILRTILLNRCLQEFQVKHEALAKKHYECKNLISEAELLRTEIDVLGNKCFQECRPKYNALKDILAQETSERKRLYNEVIEFRGNIRVFCRCRPLSTDEVSKDYNSTIDFDPYKDTELQITCTDSSRKIFKFDCVFNPKDVQDVVFAETLPVVKSVMDGFNVCIFAYGQTGTGKTFTMEGSPECRGVNYRALKELFRIMKERILLMRYEFSFSMLEVYNEKIKDLLAENSDSYTKKLDIKQSAEGTQEVPGLTEVQVCSVDEAWKLHKFGGKNRSVGSTTANELSSRSHSLVRVMVMGESLVTGERSRSFLWLVDLAGSERVGKIEVEGERLKESQFINKSLSALGDVISALASKNSHIPYRNSKLTHLLQSSLGGDCKTLMFAQISPSPADLGETLCTLNFASRVRGVEHGPARKQSDSADSFKIKQMAEKLRMEEKQVSKLNESLQMMHIKYASRENVIRTLQEKVRESEHACKDYQQKITDLQNHLAAERKGKKTVLGSAVNAKSASSLRPPLASGAVSRQRLPLARITNLLPPLAHPMPYYHHRASAAKENTTNIGWSKSSSFAGKARRISLSPIVCSSSISKNTTGAAAAAKEDNASKLPQLSMMMIRKRRATVTSAATFQGTPIGGEQGKSRLQQQHQQTLWKANLPSFSPLQQQPGKLCYSIHKRVLLGASPARPVNLLEAKEIPGRFGVAGRILIKNQRRSVAL